MNTLRTASLIAAVLTTGLMAGLFQAFSYAVMPGLGAADDRTFIQAFQRINEAITNGWFLLLFLGALVSAGLAGVLHVNVAWRSVLWWIVAGFVLYAATLAITGGISVPMNDTLMAAGDVDQIPDLAAVREAFEDRWNRWNLVRSVTSTAAFASLTWALVLHARLKG